MKNKKRISMEQISFSPADWFRKKLMLSLFSKHKIARGLAERGKRKTSLETLNLILPSVFSLPWEKG